MPSSPAVRRAVATSTALCLGLVLSACSPAEPVSPSPTVSEPTPAAAVAPAPPGTVDDEGGFIAIGAGATVVDLYVDPMCPYCKLFEQTSGAHLVDEAQAGHVTLRVHPVAILNRLSRGTDYSTRAAAVLTAATKTNPDAAAPLLAALYVAQPAENTAGLSDEHLVDLAIGAGADPALREEDLTDTRAWVDTHTAAATTGPLSSTREIPSIEHVPTVVVNGAVFPGNSTDTAAFAAFLASH